MTREHQRGAGGEAQGPRFWWWAAALMTLWLPVWWRLKEVWQLDPEMKHGWLVPPLVAYYAWERRKYAPAAQVSSTPLWAVLGGGAFLLGMSGLVVWEANPMWPRLMWFVTGILGVATLALIGATGGGKRVRYWAGAVALLALTLPWPTMLQQPLTLGLASMNAQVAAEVVSAWGYPAAVHGRVIEVGAGFAGVEEACSGIRSLQTVTMVAVFLAAFFRLGWRRGIGLVLVGWSVAVVGNLVRTCYLILVLAQEGTDQMNAMHDTAGNVVLGVTLAAMAAISWSLTEGPMPPKNTTKTSGQNNLKWGALVALVVTVGSIEAAIYGWYSGGQIQSQRVGWTWTERADWTAATVPDAAQEMLGYSNGSGRYWAGEADLPATLAFLFHWDGDLRRLGGAALHDPTICLPGIGSVMMNRLPKLPREIPEGEIALDGYRFRTSNGQTQFVFFQVWDAFRAEAWQSGEDAHWSRWERVKNRRRGADIYQLILVFEGEMGEGQAMAHADRLFRSTMKPVVTE